MNDDQTTLRQLKACVHEFTSEREWQPFHDLKNLSMALTIEAGELMEHFRWLPNTDANAAMQDAETAAAIREEVADVLLFLVQFANVAQIDLAKAAEEKLAINAKRYPIEKSKGIATKYDQL